MRTCLQALALAIAALGLTPAANAAPPAAAAPASTAPASEAPTTQHHDVLRLLDWWLEAQVAYNKIPSLAAGVVVGQDLVWSKGYGFVDDAKTKPAGADTLYSICSISKLFTAISVMKLWEQGKVGLDDDIAKYVSPFPMKRSDPDSGPITVRMLLMHAAGVPREALQETWTPPHFNVPSREALLADLAKQQTFMRTGDHFQYSNLGMFLLGEVVAKASGMPYAQYVSEQVVAPLKLVDTQPHLQLDQLEKRLPPGYSALNRRGERSRMNPFDMRPMAAAAGFTSTVNDLARFVAWNFKLRSLGGQDVIKASTLREMQRVQWTDPDGEGTWGLGFYVGNDGSHQVIGHGGNCPGYETAVNMMPSKQLGIVSLTNTHGSGPYGTAIRKLVAKGMKLPIAPTAGDAPRLADYMGHYDEQPMGGETLIVPWGKDLASLEVPSTKPADDLKVLRHVRGDVFAEVRKDDTLGAEYRFVRGADGKVKEMRSWNYVSPKLD